MTQPLTARQATNLILKILAHGTVVFHSHATLRMRQRKLTRDDIYRVLRAGWMYLPPEMVRGEWRYKFEIPNREDAVVVEFTTDTESLVVTVW